ncbi:28S ribosomal protein S11, mitochondrial [Neodiprion virginianus]|uniref:28S ribosomal protein S11, mitochondrial n=1 Tax=Neodiprion virginianus TaxID=2961670 RepID=UPI001EE76646|nr:28S ribosomal protein S11, mitochondrial [Neodiprion virginianus]
MIKSALRLLASPSYKDRLLSPSLLSEGAKFTVSTNIWRNFHATTRCQKAEDKKMMLASLPPVDEGTKGEKSIQIDNLLSSSEILFPDETTPFRLHDGTPYKDLPICNIKVSHNNTIISLTDCHGKVQMIHTCGKEGFKNTRKGTNIAAQATATTFGARTLRSGIKTVRVRIRGIGPGRMSSIKGLQIGGLDIVSVTDNTHVSWTPPRPRKARRL